MPRTQRILIGLAAAVCCVAALPAVGAAPAAALSFAPPVHYDVGGKPADLASANLNHDGRPDIVVSAGNGVAVLLATQQGRFAAAKRVPLEHRPGAVALADVNRDGAVDIVTANRDDTVTVLLGDGSGAFVAHGTFPTGKSPTDVVVGDFTADGLPDVATADASGDGLSLLAGDSTGALLPPVDLPVGEGCRRVVAGDLNGDGNSDLAFTRFSWDDYAGFGVLLGDGAGGFFPMAYFRTHLEPIDLALGDLNCDGTPDIPALDGLEGDGGVDAFLGDGQGTFINACNTVFSRNVSVSGLAVADLNRDGRDDVITSGYMPGYTTSTKGHTVTVPPGPPRIYLLLSHTIDGVFFEPTSFLAGRLVGEIVADDFNRDRKPDLATTDVKTRSVSVRMRGILPVVTGVSPQRARVGAVVTLTGRHLGARGVVRFGGKSATDYISWSATRIRVKVPRGTPKGSVQVTVTTVIGQSAPRSFFRL